MQTVHSDHFSKLLQRHPPLAQSSKSAKHGVPGASEMQGELGVEGTDFFSIFFRLTGALKGILSPSHEE